jgi:hypothetical protein
MKRDLPSVRELEATLRERGLMFYAKQGRALGELARLRKLNLYDLQKLPAEHRRRLLELFERVRWEHLTPAQQKIEKLIEEIPSPELRRLKECLLQDNPFSSFFSFIPGWVSEQAELKTLKACRDWLAKTPAERGQWFREADAVIAQEREKQGFYRETDDRKTTPGLVFYQILGIEPGATLAEIKAAFRLKARATHPDHGGDSADFKRLMVAYRRLSDKRA